MLKSKRFRLKSHHQLAGNDDGIPFTHILPILATIMTKVDMLQESLLVRIR